jgi:hypothetical protein
MALAIPATLLPPPMKLTENTKYDRFADIQDTIPPCINPVLSQSCEP